MKLAMCGAGGTGKTTILNWLRTFRKEPALPSIAKTVNAEFGVESEDGQKLLSRELQWELQREITRRSADFELQHDNFITDRSMVDRLSYAWLKNPLEFDDPETRAAWINRALFHVKRLDLLIYFPVGLFDPPDNGFRSQHDGERWLFHYVAWGFINSWGLDNVLLIRENTPEAKWQRLEKEFARRGL